MLCLNFIIRLYNLSTEETFKIRKFQNFLKIVKLDHLRGFFF